MELRLTSTSKIVELRAKGRSLPARVWEGVTGEGVRCHVFITRIAVLDTDRLDEFKRDLLEQRAPSAEVEAIPLRLIL